MSKGKTKNVEVQRKPDIEVVAKKVGAKTKYKEEFCDLIIRHMAEGYTFESFAGRADVCVSRDSLYEWEKVHPEFAEAKKIGRSCQLYKDEQTLEFLTMTGAKGTTHIFKMKNCHGWRDRIDINANQTDMTYEEYLKQIGSN